MKVRVKDGVKDISPYTPNGDIFEFSGLTGTCKKSEFYDGEEVIMVSFDKRSLALLPQAYIDHADEIDEDYSRFIFYKKDLEVIDITQKPCHSFSRIDMDIMRSL